MITATWFQSWASLTIAEPDDAANLYQPQVVLMTSRAWTLHGIKLLVFNKRMAMKLEASFSLTNINDSVKVIQLPLSKSIICGSQAPRSVWIIVIKYLQRGKISQFSCWKNVRACSSYDLTRGSYSLSPVLPRDVPIQVDGGHHRIQCVTAKPTN